MPRRHWDTKPPIWRRVLVDGSYVHDFGDHWEHRVQVEKTMPATAGMVVPTTTFEH